MPAHRILTTAEKLDPASTALILIDMQNDFCHPQGHYPATGPTGFNDLAMLQTVEAPLAALLAGARAADVLRIFVKSHFDPHYLSAPFAEKRLLLGSFGKACIANTWGSDYLEPFKPTPSPREIEVIKHRYSAFRDTDMNAILHANEIRTVVVTGVTTSVCVDSTIRDAFFNDYFVIIAGDAVADYTEEKHRVFLQQLGTLFGTVCSVEEILAHWQSS